MTEEQIKAHHNFLIRYNIEADPVVWLNLLKFVLILKVYKLICHNFFQKNYDEISELVSVVVVVVAAVK